MTYVLVVSNIMMLVAMFIAAFWGFTYPKIIVDGYESGKSAFVAAFMCCLAGICLCGLNFQNYYLLVTYAVLHMLIMLNQLFSLLPFTWTRIPNYPLTGNVSTQVYVMLVPKIFLVTFAFSLAYKLRRDEKRYELARSGGLHQRLPCHIVPRIDSTRCPSAPLNTGSIFGSIDRSQGYGTNERINNTHLQPNQPGHAGSSQPPPHLHSLRIMSGSGPGSIGQQPPAPIPAPASLPTTTSTNQIIQTPPIYPLHRPSVTDVSINSSNRPSIGHRQISMSTNQCPSGIGNHSSSCGGLNNISMIDQQDTINRTRSSGVHWRPNHPYQNVGQQPTMTPSKQWWPSSAKQQQYSPYYRDVYNPNF